jgi:hypothetical protein
VGSGRSARYTQPGAGGGYVRRVRSRHAHGRLRAVDAALVADPLLGALQRVDGMGRPLFSALRGLPLPASPHGQLWRAAELVREHRGDGHLAAVVAAGIDVLAINVLTELWLGFAPGEYSSTRGVSAEQLADTQARLEADGLVRAGALTPAGRALRDELEVDTDRSQHQLMTYLGDDVETIIDAANAISATIVTARAFPSDPRKRAAG